MERSVISNQHRKVYLIGSGIASLASAAYFFNGQFTEVPLDVVFSVEYSVRSAQTAVYELLDLDKKPIPMYQGTHHPSVLFKAIKSLVQ